MHQTPLKNSLSPRHQHVLREHIQQGLSDAAEEQLRYAGSALCAQHDDVLVITQYIDNLHERAGSASIIHMHGEILKARCLDCDAVVPWLDDLETAHACPCCTAADRLRPHIVWFGEMPLDLDRIYEALKGADLFLAIGTSGQVYPAAGFIQAVNEIGHARTIELNLEPSAVHGQFDEQRIGQATDAVPALVDELLQITS